ncbi:MAG: BatA domain-containing protein [Pirellulales bacterium]|nr:BatA domain-containing protein [Pirellulales bacterium]
MLSWLSSFTVNPALFAAGAALISAPILIHLLSRRKFRTVHWAAMDFLIAADKKNRRRVQLENLLLMLLRCLIILLIAFLVARPFYSSTAMTLFVGSGEGIERIVILDDSPSMAVGESFENARERLIQFVEGLAEERPRDRVTVYVTSDPEQPYGNLSSREIYSDNLVKLVASEIGAIPVSAQVADLAKAVQEVSETISDDIAEDKNRIVYVISDMRKRDWETTADGEDPSQQVAEGIKALAGVASGVYLVDVATDEQLSNLSVVSVAPADQTLVAGVPTKIRATVLNTGPNEASKVPVRLAVDGTVTQKKTIATIPVGEERSVEFPYTFLVEEPAQVRVEIDGDALHADDERFFAAQVRKATEVLLVQEDTVYDRRRDEPTFFVRSVLKPRGYASGFAVDEATETELDGVDLEKYDVIFLCNLPTLTAKQTKRLEDWVSEGGGLFVALGDAVNKQSYNKRLYKGGKGLLPVKIVGQAGSSDQAEWAHLEAAQPNHPAVDIYSGETAILARQVKIFEWWKTEADPKHVVANLTDLDSQPLLVEKAYGKGRVSVWTTTINDAWNNIPLDDSFAWVIARNTEHIRRTRSELTTQDVGQPIQYEFDAARYRRAVRLTGPDGEQVPAEVEEVQVAEKEEPAADSEKPDGPDEPAATTTESTSTTQADGKEDEAETSEDAAGDNDDDAPADDEEVVLEESFEEVPGETLAADQLRTPYRVECTETGRRGFYELTLKGFDDEPHSVLFARNIDPAEGQLQRMDTAELTAKFGSSDRIKLIQEAGSLSVDASGTRQSYWRQVLIALLVVLAVEQSLAWYFGTKR